MCHLTYSIITFLLEYNENTLFLVLFSIWLYECTWQLLYSYKKYEKYFIGDMNI